MQTNRKRRNSFFLLVLAIVLLGMGRPASAQKEASADAIAEVVVSDLDAPTDFSVTADGEVVFIAEQGAQQIRRVRGDANEIVVSGIESDGQSAESITVYAINPQRVLVGVSGFSSAKQSLCQFDISAEQLPLDFNDQHLKHSKSYEGALKRIKGFSVLQLFREQRGLSMVFELGEASPSLCDIHFKGGSLAKLEQHKFEASIANLSTVTVDRMGGCFVAMTRSKPRQIVFYRDKRTSMQSFPIDLENIVSLSFSPIHNRLFALVGISNDNAPNDSKGDGVYEILTDGDACKSRFVIAVKRPQKMKFDEQGNAWVLCQSDADNRVGLLKKISGLDVSPAIGNVEVGPTDEN